MGKPIPKVQTELKQDRPIHPFPTMGKPTPELQTNLKWISGKGTFFGVFVGVQNCFVQTSGVGFPTVGRGWGRGPVLASFELLGWFSNGGAASIWTISLPLSIWS